MPDTLTLRLPFLPVLPGTLDRLREILAVALEFRARLADGDPVSGDEPAEGALPCPFPAWFSEAFADPARCWIMGSLAGFWVGIDNTWSLKLWGHNLAANEVSEVRLVEAEDEGAQPALAFEVRGIPFGGQESLEWMIIAAGGLPLHSELGRANPWGPTWHDRGAPGALLAVLWHFLGYGEVAELLEAAPALRADAAVQQEAVWSVMRSKAGKPLRAPLFIRQSTVIAEVPSRQIRAVFDGESVVVYQAYGDAIADAALTAGCFVPPFSMDRMTWIKPSFLWMMYRCGWGLKEGQERVLAIRIRRAGFEWALRHARLSHFDPEVHASAEDFATTRGTPVRVQWDPERSLTLQALPFRSIQIGLRGEAVRRYVHEWTLGITEITEHVHAIRALLDQGELVTAQRLLPDEAVYAVPPGVGREIGLG
ncbi:MAG: DUF4291 domain-containing protein [Pseudomonadota bacterium]